MNRRSILAAGGASLGLGIGLSGCLEADRTTEPDSNSDGDGTDTTENGTPTSTTTSEFEQCHLVSIDYESLPDAIRAEVDAALEDGRYETENLLFDDAIDPDRSFVVVDDEPYDPRVETDGETRTLELEVTDTVRLPEPAVVRVTDSADRAHEVHVELTDDDGETVVGETVSLEPGEERELEATDEFGRYELTARARTGHGATDEFDARISDSRSDGTVSVTDDGIVATQSAADMFPCPWDARYD
ncbi:hypothetical protein [Natrinema versiforme]|uniref:Ig-like domain-containing protein n=1 Tax=Natrinema versiforme JCM 10478 TaxID=1227496 RepID=L9XQV5_9EURY|nr:hypothetical protein [Natrinema versiforme]ELY63912.1 hypothetical protein C489_17732 [Natrinema versiforme JCM 10478]